MEGIYNQREICLQMTNVFFFLIKHQSIDKPPGMKKNGLLCSAFVLANDFDRLFINNFDWGESRRQSIAWSYFSLNLDLKPSAESED